MVTNLKGLGDVIKKQSGKVKAGGQLSSVAKETTSRAEPRGWSVDNGPLFTFSVWADADKTINLTLSRYMTVMRTVPLPGAVTLQYYTKDYIHTVLTPENNNLTSGLKTVRHDSIQVTDKDMENLTTKGETFGWGYYMLTDPRKLVTTTISVNFYLSSQRLMAFLNLCSSTAVRPPEKPWSGPLRGIFHELIQDAHKW